MDESSGNLWFQTSVCCLEVYVRSRQKVARISLFPVEGKATSF
jgi:hypothetical protein